MPFAFSYLWVLTRLRVVQPAIYELLSNPLLSMPGWARTRFQPGMSRGSYNSAARYLSLVGTTTPYSISIIFEGFGASWSANT